MSSEDKAKSTGEQIKGKVKETAGKVTGNDRLKGEGLADQAKGTAREKKSEAEETARGMWEEVKGEDGGDKGPSRDS